MSTSTRSAHLGFIVLAVALSLWLLGGISWAPGPARAEGHDGKYAGTISCAAIPGQTAGPLLTPFSMRVTEGRVEYEREVMRPEDSRTKLGVTERGAGTVSPAGEVSLSGAAGRANWSYQAIYRGRIEGDAMRLSGTQIWHLPGRAEHERPCSITLTRSE